MGQAVQLRKFSVLSIMLPALGAPGVTVNAGLASCIGWCFILEATNVLSLELRGNTAQRLTDSVNSWQTRDANKENRIAARNEDNFQL